MAHNASAKRLAKEFRQVSKAITDGSLASVSELSTVDDNLHVWRFHLHSFDGDTPAGAALTAQLAALTAYNHPAALVMEARFPPDYPHAPFFLRVVSPRIRYLRGHVTAGGSICIEALTLSGSDASWKPSYTFEQIIVTVAYNMLHCEETVVRTATGPGGVAGPLALDTQLGRGVVRPYSMAEAEAAFQRTLHNHGWGGGGSAGRAALRPAAQPAAPPAPRAAVRRPPPVPAAAPAPPPRSVASPRRAAAAGPHSPVIDLTLLSDEEEQPPRRRPRVGAAPPDPPPPPPPPPPGVDLTTSLEDVVDLVGPSSGVGPSRFGRLFLRASSPAAPPPPPPPPPPPRKRPRTPPPPSLEDRLAIANAQTGLHLMPPPPHWRVSDPLLRGELCFVELPVPGAAQRGAPAVDAEALQELMANGLTDVQAHAALAAAGNDLQRAVGALLAQRMARPDAQALQELLLNGVSQEDAAAALEAKGGDVEEALLFCLETADRGGPAKLARRGKAPRGAAPAPPTGEAQARAAAAEAARKAAEVKEVAAVLQRFEAHGGVSSARVERVERVQNLVLWRDFAQRRARLELEARSGANMQRLFHGAAKDTLSTICREGFDIRVSNLSGALGAGVYFAQSSGYSDSYARAPSRTVDPATGRGPAGPRGGARFPFPFPFPLGPPPAPSLPPAAAAAATAAPSPAFVPGCVAMLLCDVLLGASASGNPAMRRPPPGFHSSSGGGIWAVYENSLAYPAYVVHYT